MTLLTSSRLRSAACLAAAVCLLAPAVSAQTTVVSSPVGVMTARVARGHSGLALPLLVEDVFVGTVESNTPTTLTFVAPNANVGALLQVESPYYVEVMTGPLEGERLDVDVEATISLGGPAVMVVLDADSYSTLAVLGDDVLVGARCVVRPHLTLARLQGMLSPGLVGREHAGSADGVQVLEGQDFDLYFLREDGLSWNREGEGHGRRRRHHRHQPPPEDFRDKVLPPDASFVVQANSSRQTWLQTGEVRVNAFRKNLEEGFQSFATGFPVDLSPRAIGGFVDPAAPPQTRWTGSNMVFFADHFEVLFQERRPLELYYLRGDGVSWRSLTGHTNFADAPILGSTDMLVLRRLNPNPTYSIARPFGL